MDGMKIDESLIPKIIGIVIALVVVGMVLVPFVTEATTTEKTFENPGYYEMTYSEADDLTLVWDYTNPNIITVNDQDITIPDFVNPGTVNVICGDSWFLRWYGTGVGFYCSTSSGAVPGDVTDQTSVTLTASNGTVTVTNDAATPATMTDSYTFMYVLDPTGKYVMKDATQPVYLKGDSDIYAIGRSAPYGATLKLKITGNIDDGFEAETIGTTSTTITEVDAVYTPVSNYKDLYKLTEFDVKLVDEGVEKTAVYNYFIVPATVTAELSQHANNIEITLYQMIPILVVLGILLGIVGQMYFNRNEQ